MSTDRFRGMGPGFRQDDVFEASDSIFKQPIVSLSSSGLTGRSSIPEMSAREPIGRSVLDRPPSRAMTRRTGHTLTFSPRIHARALHRSCPSSKAEGAGKAGWPLAPGVPAQKRVARGAKTTGTGGTNGELKRSSQHRLVFFSPVTATRQAPPLAFSNLASSSAGH